VVVVGHLPVLLSFLLSTPSSSFIHFPSSFGLIISQRQPEEGRWGKKQSIVAIMELKPLAYTAFLVIWSYTHC